jgi:chromosome segregation ATPase
MQGDKDNKQDDGSVWTSYSDLFTTVAIIFLVMFVFALIKAGVSTMQSIAQKRAHEAELQGKLDPKSQQKVNSQLSHLEASVDEIKDYEELITDKVVEINNFAKKLQQNKKVMQQLIAEQQRKEAMVNSAQQLLAEKLKVLAQVEAQKKLTENELEQKTRDLAQIQTEKHQQIELTYELNQKIQQMELANNELVQNFKQQEQKILAEHEKTVQKMHAEFKNQSSLLSDKLIELEKNKDIEIKKLSESYAQSQKAFETEINEVTKQVNLVKNEKTMLESNLAQSELEISDLKQRASDLEQEMRQKEIILSKTNSKLNEKDYELTQLNQRISQLTTNNENLNAALDKKQSELSLTQSKLTGLESTLKEKLGELEQKKSQLFDSYANQEKLNQQIGQLNEKLSETKFKESSLSSELEKIHSEKETLARKIASSSSKHSTELQDYESKIKNLEEQLLQAQFEKDILEKKTQQVVVDTSKEDEYKRQLDLMLKENDSLKSAVKDIAQKISGVKNQIRGNIAKKLAETFKKANIAARVDPKTGNVTLDLGKNFLFKVNSDKLSHGAKLQLNKIIPLYSEVLFADKNISDQIASFNIEGHASPVWGKRFISPNEFNPKAHSYNIELSGRRASSIISYIFGKKVGSYNFKNELKQKTRAIGYGYTQPVKFNGDQKRSIASQNICYPFDCALSQRVELSFTLKDDDESIKKLLNINVEVP